MAVQNIAGFETGDLTELVSSSGTPSINSTAANLRTGGYSLNLDVTLDQAHFSVSGTNQASVSFYVKGPFNNASTQAIAVIEESSGSDIIILQVAADNTLALAIGASGTSTATVSTTAWNHIEIVATRGTGSNGVCEVWLDGVKVIDDTAATWSAGDFGRLNLVGLSSSAHYFDDVVVRNDNTRHGDSQVLAVRPNAVGDETGATGSFADIDDDPINDTTGRTESSGPAFVDNLTTIASVGTINAAKACVRASRSSGAGRTHFIRIKKGATTENSADLALGTSVGFYQFFPTNQPTSQAELDAYQGGMSQSASGGRVYTCTEFWLMVDYTPSVAASLVFSPIGRIIPMLVR